MKDISSLLLPSCFSATTSATRPRDADDDDYEDDQYGNGCDRHADNQPEVRRHVTHTRTRRVLGVTNANLRRTNSALQAKILYILLLLRSWGGAGS